jgi:hypothetical protein
LRCTREQKRIVRIAARWARVYSLFVNLLSRSVIMLQVILIDGLFYDGRTQ